MASTSSREAALERRRALTNGGKKAVSRYTQAPSRVRSASDARPSRTNGPAVSSEPAAEISRPVSRPQASRSLAAPSQSVHRSAAKPMSNPSRELGRARREALSKRGKRAETSRDRTRADAPKPVAAAAVVSAKAEHKCKCHDTETAPVRTSTPSLSLSSARASSRGSSALGSANGSASRSSAKKVSAQHNPSRALVLARREALSKRGKLASTDSSRGSAAVVRLSNPDLTTRELAQKVRELKSKAGSAGTPRSGGTRPSGPNRNGAKTAAAAEASLKVGVSETLSGQVVTGTQANRSTKTTGNEAATCREITGTEYMGAEIFRTFCQSEPGPSQPAKVRVTATSHGNRVTGNEVGRSEKVTGDEPGTCKSVTGTEYISANQSAEYCGAVVPSPRKVAHSQTQGGRAVSGVMVGRSEKVTGDEAGSGLQLTGDQYLGNEPPVGGRAPAKVDSFNTLRGTGITGTSVGRSERVTGDEPGTCRLVTGDEYVGSQQYDRFCGTRPAPEAAKVGFSVTNKALVVSGTRTDRSEKVTGNEPGTCKLVTGTPYAGIDQAADWCSSSQVKAIRQRTPARAGTPGPRLSGQQPGIGGVMTGGDRGACENVTGTPYIGGDQFVNANCAPAYSQQPDFPQPLTSAPWQQFSVQSPASAAIGKRDAGGSVTGSSYELGGGRVTGPFDLAGDKVTGTEQFRFDRGGAQLGRLQSPARARLAQSPAPQAEDLLPDLDGGRPVSRVTGEGISAGLKITGDDWDRGERVTGTEGRSARRRNPTRTGTMSAMPSTQPKRNDEVAQPVSRVTGASGNTDKGSLITVSGGARG
ncbi:MAG: CsoS2 family carboxysome shell protein [Cyanobacteria bacterium]|nr:CsoS2 family carboxysome shell protein [Cyanobacteriota bacterium]